MIEWHGAEVLDDIGQRIDRNMLELGEKVVAEAVRFAPFKTGKLRLSLTFDYNLSTHTLVFYSDMEEPNYDIFQEYGTRNMMGKPHWRPALHAVGEIYGFNTELAFANVPAIRNPLRAEGPRFYAPAGLTAKQKEHIAHGLTPQSKRLWSGGRTGNVQRTKVRFRKYNY